MKNKHKVISLLLSLVMVFMCMPAPTYARGASRALDIGSIENYDEENIFRGCKDLNSYVEFDVDDPVFTAWVFDITAKSKVTDKFTLNLQKKEPSGYKDIFAFDYPITKSKTMWTYIYSNRSSDKLTKGHYRFRIMPKKKSGSFYKAKCNVYLYDSLKAVSPSKLKKKYNLRPGGSETIAQSDGSALLYMDDETYGKHADVRYDPTNNEWYIYAKNDISSSASEKLTVTFTKGKKKATKITINPLKWWKYTLYEGEHFKECYYRWDGNEWGKWKLKNIKWYSTNSYVASVSKKGKVKAKHMGTCYIVGQYKNKTAKCKVTVYASKPRKGMTKKQVKNSRWGKPSARNDYGNGYVQWVYEWNGETDYVYFDHGRVTNIQRMNY